MVRKEKKHNKGKIDIQMRGIASNIVFSKDEVWAYYRIGKHPYDYMSNDAKTGVLNNISSAFTSMMGDSREEMFFHLIMTLAPVDVDAWRDQFEARTAEYAEPAGRQKFLVENEAHLRQSGYLKKNIYLGVRLGKRHAVDNSIVNPLDAGFKAFVDSVKKSFNSLMRLKDEEVTSYEEMVFSRKEEEVAVVMDAGYLAGERCTAEEILTLLKRQAFPDIMPPYLTSDYENRVGAGDIVAEYNGQVQNNYRYLAISHIINGRERVGYRAALTFGELPKFMSFPQNELLFDVMRKAGMPFTCYSRFTLVPHGKSKKMLERKRKEAKDELANYAKSRSGLDYAVSGMPQDMSNMIEDMQILDEMLEESERPQVYGVYRVVVEAPDADELKVRCSEIEQAYQSRNIKLRWTSGDQLKLFLEQMPGDYVRDKTFLQKTSLDIIAATGATVASEVGDLVQGSEY